MVGYVRGDIYSVFCLIYGRFLSDRVRGGIKIPLGGESVLFLMFFEVTECDNKANFPLRKIYSSSFVRNW